MDLSETVFLDPFDATKKQACRQSLRDSWRGWFKSAPIVATDSLSLGGRTINGTTTGTPTNFSWLDTSGFSKKANSIKTTWVAFNVVDGFNYQDFTLDDGTTVTSDKELLLDTQGLSGALLDPFGWPSNPANLGPKPVF